MDDDLRNHGSGEVLSTLIELVAFGCFVVAGWRVSAVLGLVVAGGALLLIAKAVDGAKLKLTPSVKVPRVKLPRVRMPRVSVSFPGRQDPEATQT